MPNNKKNLYKEWWSLVRLNLLIATVLTFSFSFKAISDLYIVEVLQNFLYSFTISLTLSSGISVIIDLTEKRISWIETPVKRFSIEIISVTAYSFIIGIIFSIISIILWNENYDLLNLPWNTIIHNTRYPVLISLGVTAILTSKAFLFEWRSAAIASEKLRADNLQGQYQSLKDQLNPHFLFNSFNTLSNLVYDDQDKAVEFIQKLSKIYRYVLEVQKEELITVGRELAFIDNYLNLQKIRFGENLLVHISDINTESYIPPLSLQLLIENAIKHNIISSEDPLEISIKEVENYLIVENNIQLKDIGEESTGIGIQNINERLSFYTDEKLIIETDKGSFIVKLPLIKSIDS